MLFAEHPRLLDCPTVEGGRRRAIQTGARCPHHRWQIVHVNMIIVDIFTGRNIIMGLVNYSRRLWQSRSVTDRTIIVWVRGMNGKLFAFGGGGSGAAWLAGRATSRLLQMTWGADWLLVEGVPWQIGAPLKPWQNISIILGTFFFWGYLGVMPSSK